MMWTLKYRPRRFEQFKGNKTAKKKAKNYDWKKPLMVYGPPGVGKTSFVHCLANELGFELVEVSDDNIEDALAISQTGSLMGGRKLIFVDNVENIKKIRKITELVKKSKNPVVLAATDHKSRRLRTIGRKVEKLNIRRQRPASIAKYLRWILKQEGIEFDKDAVKEIADHADGDLRSAVLDLETVAKGRERITKDELGILEERNRSTDIYKVLSKILVKDDYGKALASTWDLDMQPRDVLLWVDENVPRVYKHKDDIIEAFHYLSRADVFLGRIMRRQYWSFLRYAGPLMTGGVNISKKHGVKRSYFQFPKYIINMSKTKKDRRMRKSLGEKLGPYHHVSSAIVTEQYIPLYSTLLKQEHIEEEKLRDRFDLEKKEIEYLKED